MKTDVSGRATKLREIDFERFFAPASIAVIGASDSAGSPSALNYRMVRDWQRPMGTRIYPVNPNRTTVDGDECFASVLDIPGDVDVAIILVGKALEALESCAQKKIPFVVVFTAGFAESGADGKKRQAEFEALIESSETHVLGPNTPMNAFQQFRTDLEGKRIALITQSGHQGRPIYQAQSNGVALKGWAPTGNESDLESADFINWFSAQPDVGAIAMYIEGFKDGRTMMLAADAAVRRGVPIVAIKVGRSDLGRSWAQSHSGHLAGSDQVTDAVFKQFGVTRVDGLDELADVSMMLARCDAPKGNGVCVYSISGGTGAHISDFASSMGLNVAPLSQQTQEKLHEWIPSYLRVSNPVDSGGHPTGDWRGPKILETILADPAVDVLVIPVAGSFSPISDTLARDIVNAASTTSKPICVIWGSPTGDEEGYREVLLKSQVPVFRSARNCLTAVKSYFAWHAFRARYKSPLAKPLMRALPAAARVKTLLEPGRALSEHRSKEILRAYGIDVSNDVLCGSAKEAVRAAEQIGFPVVMKACSSKLAHKSDQGLVRLGVRSAKEVRTVYSELEKAGDEGVLVCEMISGGIETVVGIAQDELYGPVVMFGLGGIAIEVFKDVTFRVPPFDAHEAKRMITEIHSIDLLRGARGSPKASLSAISDVIMKVQHLAMDCARDIAELDINPLLATPRGCVALDALVICK
ncbi:MAG: acetate--CoA ligase family protein [Actinomycetota bacterium]